MSSTSNYRIIDIPLDVVTPGATPITDLAGAMISGVYYQPVSAAAAAIPVGTDLLLHFGQREGIQVTSVLSGFAFPCGMNDGVYFTNRAALAVGTKLRLLVTIGDVIALK